MSAKNSLREDQKRKLSEIDEAFKETDTVLLSGGLGTGKTIAGLAFALKNTPSILLCSSYPAVDELLASLRRLFLPIMGSVIIARPEGKIRSCRVPGCRHISIWNPENLSGIVTNETVPQGYCAYASLNEISNKRADLVITHHTVLKSGALKPRARTTLVIDECTDFLKAHDYLLLRFSGPKSTHLSIEIDNMIRVMTSLQYLGGNPPRMGSKLKKDFQEKVNRNLKEIKKVYDSLAHIAELEAKSVQDAAKNRRLTRDEILAGITSADKQIQLEVAKQNDPKLIERFRELQNEFTPGDFRGLTGESKQKMIDFWNVGRNLIRFYFRSRLPSQSSSRGYREIKMGDEIGDITAAFEKTLLISATPPPTLPQSTIVVEMDNSGYAKKIVFLLLQDDSKVRRLVQDLGRNYNILGITTSKDRAKTWIGKVGGKSVAEIGDIDEFRKDLISKKGSLLWNYYRSSFWNAVNYFHVFDGALVTDWISRDIAQVEEEPSVLRLVSLNSLVQMLGRVLRPASNQVFRSRFVIVLDPELFALLKRRYVDSTFKIANSVEEAVRLIDDFAEALPLQRRYIVRREVTLLSQQAGRQSKAGRRYIQHYLKVAIPNDFPEGKYKIVAEPVE